jgi:hypothetical protein
MTMTAERSEAGQVGDSQWAIVERWQEYQGEARANLLRAVGIAGFYIVELINYHGLRLGVLEIPKVAGLDKGFHLAVTAIAIAWLVSGLCVFVFLRNRFFPPALKVLSTGLDLVYLTTILMIADGPKSPLVAVFFLVQMLAALRFSLPLIRFAAAGSMAGYIFLLGQAKWYHQELRVPRYHQLIILLSLALTGILLGQIIRRARGAADDFAQRLARSRERAA